MTTHISDRDDRLDVLQYCGSIWSASRQAYTSQYN
jgi:hypothetical protein